MKKIIAALLLIAAFTGSVHAQGLPVGGKGDEPLEITADETLEWMRTDKKFVARGKAAAKQGDVVINADTLTADYRENKKSSFDIYRLTATGNVVITSGGHVATGEKAVYEVDTSLAVMTGDNLSLTAPEQKVTARDRFEYHVNKGELHAIGQAHATQGQDTIDADRMAAYFSKGADGKNKLDKMTADGNVVIITPTEKLAGARGIYTAAADTAELIGAVRITRGPNVLEGERAEVNLTTSVSKMYGGGNTGETPGRVRGVFYPGSEKKPDAGAAIDGAPSSTQTIVSPENSGATPPEALAEPATQMVTEPR